MADKGLSPRQKMINLMYLVLTALLALNVSAEILNAFVLFDKSIRKSTQNIQTKNDEVYNEFLKALKENPKKVQKWYDKAMEVKAKTNSLDSLMQDIKLDIIKMADKTDNPDPDNVKKKADNNVGSTVMILQGRGEELKKAIDEYREYVLSLIVDTNGNPDTSKVLYKNIVSTLNTDDVESLSEPGKKIPWVEANFEHLPVIADVAMISKFQNDLRNVESNILAHLQAQIGKGEFKFNKIEAIVTAPSNYVLKGEPFKAEVFIAASDSTQDPVIVMKDRTRLPVENGKGIYTGNTNSPGEYDIEGVIKMKNPLTGDTINFPFKSSYQVGVPSVAISPTKMNVFYIGVNNPVAITASGVPADKLIVTISGAGGKITKVGNGKYNVTVKKTGKATVRVSYKKNDGSTRSLGSMEFRCLRVPDPYPTVGGYKGGSIKKSTLLGQTTVLAKLDNFVFDLKFPVTYFNVSTTINGFVEEASTRGSKISPEQKKILGKLRKGQKVYFEDVRCKAPDGSIRQLGTISFRIQ